MSNGAMYIKDYEQHCGSLGQSFKGYTVVKNGKQLVYEKRNKSLKQNHAAHVVAGPLLAQHLIDGSVSIMRQRKKRKQAVHHDPCSPESQGAKFILFQAPFKVGKYFPKITVRKFMEMLKKDWNKAPTEARCGALQIWDPKVWKKIVNVKGVMTSKTDGGQPKTYGEWYRSISRRIEQFNNIIAMDAEAKTQEAKDNNSQFPYEFDDEKNLWKRSEEEGAINVLSALRKAAEMTFLSQLWKMSRNGAKSSKVNALVKDLNDILQPPNVLAFSSVATDKVVSDSNQIYNAFVHLVKRVNRKKNTADVCNVFKRTFSGDEMKEELGKDVEMKEFDFGNDGRPVEAIAQKLVQIVAAKAKLDGIAPANVEVRAAAEKELQDLRNELAQLRQDNGQALIRIAEPDKVFARDEMSEAFQSMLAESLMASSFGQETGLGQSIVPGYD